MKGAADDIVPFFEMLSDTTVRSDEELAVNVLRYGKILSRKLENRMQIKEEHMGQLVPLLTTEPPLSCRTASEASSVVLNICYEKENVHMVLAAGAAPPLIAFLGEGSNVELQANAAGALQSICFQKDGRGYMRDMGILSRVVPLLQHSNVKLLTRAVGVVHNMSSDSSSIASIRHEQALPMLINLLKAPQLAICGSAAGTLQNMSREHLSCDIIRCSGIEPLIDLLFGSDIASQVCASGALLNCIGPSLSPVFEHPRRKALRKVIMLSVVLGMSYHAVFTPETE